MGVINSKNIFQNNEWDSADIIEGFNLLHLFTER